MKKRIAIGIIVLLCGFCGALSAQKINRSYRTTSLSRVLEDLGQASEQYIISFIYNDLEDFTVTTDLRNCSIPDAVRAVCALYPMKITFDGNQIYVECTQKIARKVTGKVVDCRGRPVEFANIALLSATDSLFINGGVSNENGDFVIPCDVRQLLVKVTCVGYRTLWRTVSTENIGTVRLTAESYAIKGVVVKGERPQYKMANGGITVDVEHSLLSQMGTANDVLAQLPRVKVSGEGEVSVFAKGTLQIYINNKLMRDKSELQQLKSADIKSVDLITSPGARYSATVESVIHIKTKRKQGDGFSFRADANAKYNSKWGGYQENYFKFRSKGFEVFADGFWSNRYSGEDNYFGQELRNGSDVTRVKEDLQDGMRTAGLDGKIGTNYDIDDNNAVGVSYSICKSLFSNLEVDGAIYNIWRNDQPVGQVIADMRRKENNGPNHELNLYYIGKAGKWGFDFNGTYLWKKTNVKMSEDERGTNLENREVHTASSQRNRMLAGKLVLSYPVGKGRLSVGSEVTHTNAYGDYQNQENYVTASQTNIEESNLAGFAEIEMPWGNFSFDVGLRLEHIKADYYSFGVWQQEPSRRYTDWFPNLSVSWQKGLWGVQFSYVNKTFRPDYQSLRSDIQYTNRYIYESGNPYLRPSVKHSLALVGTRSWLSAEVGYNYIKNDILWMATLYENRDIAFLRNRNVNHTQNVYVSVVASPRFVWFQPTIELDYRKQLFDARAYGSSRKLNKPQWKVEMKNKFVITSTCFAMLNMWYSTGSATDLSLSKQAGSIDISLIKSFFQKSFTVNLYVTDLLKTNKERWTMYGNNVDLWKDCYNYERRVGITLTYNFNASHSKYKGTGAGNDEKRRL